MVEGVFYAKAAAFIAAGLAMALGSIGPALGQGLIGMKACESIAKCPEKAGELRTTMLLAMGLVETSAIYALLISGILIAVGTGLN